MLNPHCAVFLRGKDLSPDEATELLHIKPESCAVRGSPRKFGNKDGTRVNDTGFWCLDSRNHLISSRLEDHLFWMMEAVVASKAKEIAEVDEVRILVYIYINENYTGDTLPSAFVAYAGSLGATIDIHIAYWPANDVELGA